MSDMARKARLALKAKAKALAGEKDVKTDSSDWKQAEPLNADVKTGARPVSRRAFKKGGKVEGEKAKANMGKKQRAMGGSTPRSFANAKINRNVKDANEERSGKKHIGAFKKGGRARHGYATDGQVSDDDRAAMTKFIEEKALDRSPSEGLRQVGKGVKSREVEAFDLYDPQQLKRLEAGRKKGGRAKRAGGGRDSDYDDPNSYWYGADKTASDTAISRSLREHGIQSKKINGVIHALDPDQGPVAIGNDVRKLKSFLGYKKGGRAKKQAGGAMMMDPRLGMVKPTAFEFTNGSMVPGLKKGGKVHSDEAMDKALIKKMVKKEARKGRAGGGRQSFNSAFAEARKNGMDLFEWNGKMYNTKLAEGPKSVPTPPRRPGFDIGAGERPEQSGRELANEPPPRRMTTINETDAMGSPTGMTREVEQPQGRSLRETLGDAIGIRGRNTPMFSRGSGSQIYSGPRDESESGRKKGGRAKRACGGYAGGGMAEQGGKRGKKGSGKTNINIVIASGKPADQQQMQQMPPAPPPGMMPPPPPGGAPMPPPDMGGMAPPPMGRKRGGRAAYAAGGKPVSVGTTTTANRPRVNTIAPAPGLTTTTTTPRPAVGTTTTTQRPPVGTTTTTTPRPGLGTTTTMPQMPTPVRGPLMTPPIGAPAPRPPVQQPVRDPGFGTPGYDLGPRQPFPGMQPPQTVMPGTPGMGPQFPIRDPGLGGPMVQPGFDQPISGLGRLPVGTTTNPPQPVFGGPQGGPMVQPGIPGGISGLGRLPVGTTTNPPEPVFGGPQGGPMVQPGMVGIGSLTPQQIDALRNSQGAATGKMPNAGTQPTQAAAQAAANAYMQNLGMGAAQRKSGGRVTKVAKSYQDMEAGAGSGEGRLQKTDIAKRIPKKREDGENVYEGKGYPNKVPGATGGRTARQKGGGVR